MQVKQGRADFDALGPGTMVVDMTLDDGSKWKGRFFVAPAVRTSLSGPVFNGTFEVDRLKGKGFVGLGTVMAAGIGPNGPVFISFTDTEFQPGLPAVPAVGSFELSTDLSGIVDAEGGGIWERVN